MGSVTVQKNTTLPIPALNDVVDSGWAVSGGNLSHTACSPGFAIHNSFETTPSEEYVVEFEVIGWVSGQVYPIIGGTQGSPVSANGKYTQTLVATDDTGISFWSDGELTVTNLSISSGERDSVTLGYFNEGRRFTSFYSFDPEFFGRYMNRLFTFKNGTLWEQETNEDRGSFYGEEYPAEIKFWVNIEHTVVKTLMSIRQVGNLPWRVDIILPPIDGKSEGQKSRIKAKDMIKLQGQWFADFKKDMNDPRFLNELDALFEGADLQGAIAEITLTNKETKQVRLSQVDVVSAPSQYTY